MQKNLNIKTNIVFNVICQLIGYLAPLLVSPYISRVLSPEGIGQYSYASSVSYYFLMVIIFGFSSLGINKISENREDKAKYSKYFWAIMVERIVFLTICTGIYLGILLSNQFNGKVNLGVGLALVVAFVANCFDIRFLFQGLENFRIVTIMTTITHIFYVVGVYLFVKDANGLVFYVIIQSSLVMIINLFLLPFAVKLISRASLDWGLLWHVFKGSAVYFLPNILANLGGKIDQTLIGSFCGDAEVGYYTMAEKFPTLISSVTYSITPVILSRTSLLHKEGKKEEIKTKITQAMLLALFISIPCSLGLAAIADVFIPLYFGSEYVQSVAILYYLLPCTIVSPLGSIIIYGYFFPTGKTRLMTFYQAASIALNVGLTILLVSVCNMGAVGAALGTTISNTVLLILLLISSKGFVDGKYFWKDAWKTALAGALIFGAVFAFNYFVSLSDIYLIIIDVVIGVVLFALTVLLSKEFVCYLALDTVKKKLLGRKKADK